MAGLLPWTGASALPFAGTPLIGRERALREVSSLLGQTRLVTVTGAGGIGKTRLALEIAAGLRASGVAWIDLAPVADRSMVGPAMLRALGITEHAGKAPVETVVAVLARRVVTLVIDNCEHLPEAVAAAAAFLLSACPGVRILATSRHPLAAVGETVWRLPGLAVPPVRAAAEVIERSDAVRLFVDRARRHRGDLSPGLRELPIIGGICRQLDGVPLAIELAAARARVLSAGEISGMLGRSLQVLEGGPPTVPARQRGLRASLDWSYGLLGEAERVLFRRVSVFAGAFAFQDAARVCGFAPLQRDRVLDALTGLVDHSLVAVEVGPAGSRFGMLQLVRQYAAERLASFDEEAAVRDRHLRRFAALAGQADELLRQGAAAADRLDEAAGDLRAAMRHALRADADAALAVAAGLARYWQVRGHYREGRAALERALSVSDAASPTLRAAARWGAGHLAIWMNDFVAAREHAAAAEAAAEESRDPRARAQAAILTANTLFDTGPAATARRLREVAGTLRDRGRGDELTEALMWLAAAETTVERWAAVREAAAECAELAGPHDEWTLSWCEFSLALADLRQGRLTAASQHAERGSQLGRDAPPGRMSAAVGLLVLVCRGEAARARDQASAAFDEASSAGAVVVLPTLAQAVCLACMALDAFGAATAWAGRLCAVSRSVMAVSGHEALAKMALGLGQGNAAVQHAADLAAASERIGGLPRHAAVIDYVLGRVALLDGEWARGRVRLHDALRVQAAQHDECAAYDTLDALGAAAAAVGDWRRTVRLLAAAQAGRSRIGAIRVPPETDWLAGLRADALAELGSERLTRLWHEGAALSAADAFEYAGRGRGSRTRPGNGWEALTPTEAQVADLAAQGLANPAIAARLLMSRSAVKLHLSRAYVKLGVANRTELAAATARRRPAGERG